MTAPFIIGCFKAHPGAHLPRPWQLAFQIRNLLEQLGLLIQGEGVPARA